MAVSEKYAALFDESVVAIERAYERLGHRMGWRFLMGPRSTLSSASEMAFITLNPGGEGIASDQPTASSERGNAYWTETWSGRVAGAAPLQRQVQRLLSEIVREIGTDSDPLEFMDRRVVSGYFIPFRSPNIRMLKNPRESTAFSMQLWRRIFSGWVPRVILTIDRSCFRAVVAILKEGQSAALVNSQTFQTGWGAVRAESVEIIGIRSDGPITVARLTHLSRFQVFGNPKRDVILQKFVKQIVDQL